MTDNRKKRYNTSALKLVSHLDAVLCPTNGYPDEPSWGYAFSYLTALLANEGQTSAFSEKSIHFLKKQDTNNPNYSWEFVVFALKKASIEINNSLLLEKQDYREKGTRMFNWFLLRNANKKFCDIFSITDFIKLRLAALIYQEKSGLILDEFKTRSLQYHAFCLFVLSELVENMPNADWLKKWFVRGVNYAVNQILTDGTALYIGRGQEQIFGYGSLLYAMEYCHKIVKPLDENILNSVCNKVLSFQREDGSYPLVLRHREPESAQVSFKVDHPAGWYGYNTLYDYEPFLAYCLLKAGRL